MKSHCAGQLFQIGDLRLKEIANQLRGNPLFIAVLPVLNWVRRISAVK